MSLHSLRLSEPYASELEAFKEAAVFQLYTMYTHVISFVMRQYLLLKWNHPASPFYHWRLQSFGSLDYNFNPPHNEQHTLSDCLAVIEERNRLQDAGLWHDPNGWENFEPQHYEDGCLCRRTQIAQRMGEAPVGGVQRRWDLE